MTDLEAPPHQKLDSIRFIQYIYTLYHFHEKRENWIEDAKSQATSKALIERTWHLLPFFNFLKFSESLRVTNNRKSSTQIRRMKSYFSSTNAAEIWLCQALVPHILYTQAFNFLMQKLTKGASIRMTKPFGYILKRKACVRKTLEPYINGMKW